MEKGEDEAVCLEFVVGFPSWEWVEELVAVVQPCVWDAVADCEVDAGRQEVVFCNPVAPWVTMVGECSKVDKVVMLEVGAAGCQESESAFVF